MIREEAAPYPDGRSHISHSLSQEISLTTYVQNCSLEVKRGVMLNDANYP